MPHSFGQTGAQDGVTGTSTSGRGVHGESTDQVGVIGISENFVGVWGESQSPANAGQPGVFGKSPNWQGVHGESTDQVGVIGISENFVGVWGESQSPANAGQPGVFGKSPNWQGVHGESTDQVGVIGISENFVGVWGESQSPANAGQPGVFGKSPNWQGVHGESTDQVGVIGISENFVGVWGQSQKPGQPGVYGEGPSVAGRFVGDVEVTGDVRLIGGQDCAETFETSAGVMIESGSVMVISEAGTLRVSDRPYDTAVVGVMSGAGGYRPALLLAQEERDVMASVPVALLGKVYCKVDATYAAVAVGDLLTTSPTPGHGMKVTDPKRAFGAVIGKALQPLSHGRSLISILIALQ